MEPSQVVFLLGAGSSVKAGVPDTFRFVQEFQKYIRNRPEAETIQKIVDILTAWKHSKVDIELLLDTLTKLANKEDEPLLKFFEGGSFILRGYAEKQRLVDELKTFIKRKAIITSQNNIKYFEPLLGFVEKYGALDIISVNYDTCIEQFCEAYSLVYQDGFDVNFNPEVFERENNQIRLYKLHGSVIWYRSDRGNYVKVPVMTQAAGIKLITGERAESLMLYPMQKFDYAEPLVELLTKAKQTLQSAHCKFLVIVGYSFRDDYIQRIILDVAKKNRDLTVIIIDPAAYQIYQSKLKYYPSNIPSSLNGRVVCLPYKFEEVLPSLNSHYLVNLQLGLTSFNEWTSLEKQGLRTRWTDCLVPLANAEYVEKVELIINDKIQELLLSPDWEGWSRNIETQTKTMLNLVAGGQDYTEWKTKLENDLRDILVTLTQPEISIKDRGILIDFSKPVPSINIERFVSLLRSQYSYIKSRSDMTSGGKSLVKSFTFIEKALAYLDFFMTAQLPISSVEYAGARYQNMQDIAHFTNIVEPLRDTDSNENRNSLILEIRKTENGLISDIFNE